MKQPTPAVTSLVAAPLLSVLSVLLQPEFPATATARLAAIAAAGWHAPVSAASFTVGQLPMIVAALAIAHLLRLRSPRLGAIGAGLLVAGSFAHAVYGGYTLAQVAMADDAGHRGVYAGLIDSVESSPFMLFAVIGLVGTVLGLLLLSIGIFRAHVGPTWVAPALWGFLVVEFAGTSLSSSASYLSSLLFLAAFLALAVEASRTWQPEHPPVRGDVRRPSPGRVA